MIDTTIFMIEAERRERERRAEYAWLAREAAGDNGHSATLYRQIGRLLVAVGAALNRRGSLPTAAQRPGWTDLLAEMSR